MSDDYGDEAQGPASVVWLTTEQVRQVYSLDPARFIADPGAIKSKLVQVYDQAGVPVMLRVWHKDSVEAKVAAQR